MARISQDEFSGQSDASETKTVHIDANGNESIEVPNSSFISDSEMSRDGQDLVLEAPNGDTLVVKNYFMADPAPLIESPDGSILTSNLVHSFLNSPAQFAQAASMADESPVGAIEEMSGQATIIHADGTSEPATLGTPIFEGDIIETAENGAVNVVFIDETSMAVSQNARLSVDDYKFDPSTESGETNLSVLRGVFVFTSGLIGRDDPDDVMIDTPVGSIGIRGTIIAGHIQPGGESEITVMEGAIVVRNGAMETTLSQQYESVRLSGFNDEIHNTGVKDSHDMGKTYGSVSDVVPKLFSSINDTAKEETNTHDGAKEATADDNTDNVVTEDNGENQEIKADDTLDQPQEQHDILDFKLDGTLDDGKLMRFKDGDRHRTEKRLDGRSEFLNEQKETFEAGDDDDRQPALYNGGTNTTGQLPVTAAGHNVTVGTILHDLKIGDFDGDGDNDFAIINSSGDLVIKDTPTGTVLFSDSTNDYKSLAAVGDIDNDGYADVVVGAPDVGGFQNGNAYFVGGDFSTASISPLGPIGGTLDEKGYSVSGAGDFNGDGYLDIAVGLPGSDTAGLDRGEVSIVLGNGQGDITVTGHSNGMELGEHVEGVGDVNGDGLSDLFIATDGPVGGNYEAYLILGGSGNVNTGAMSASQGFKVSVPHEILSGGAVGDTNGDGFDDFAVSLKVGNDIDTYVIYGKDAMGTSLTNIDMTYLNDPNKALKIHHAGAGFATEYDVDAVGDVNGDGFDDLQVGIAGGTQFLVKGGIGGNAPYAMDGTATDGSGGTSGKDGVLSPNGSGPKALVGDVDFIDNSESDLSMRGGSSENNFLISNNGFKNIDGGRGFDTIEINADVNFSNINFEQISQIERLQVGDDYRKMTLTAENIFNMLQTSDNGELKIERSDYAAPSGNARYLEIDASIDYADDSTGVVSALGEQSGGTVSYQGTENMNGASYDHYKIGGYDLYIDQGLTTTVV